MSEKQMSPFAAGITGVFSALFGLTAGWIAYSTIGIDHHVPLQPALRADRNRYQNGQGIFVSYYVDKSQMGRPLVLIHSINAAASAYEMRPLFNHYRSQRPVYALDLPGFGFSERPSRVYSPSLYKESIIDFLQTQVGEPADVITLSLSSEFAALAALEQPALFHSLTMISPSGFFYTSRGSETTYQILSFPLWSQAFYDLLTTRPSIHYYLQQSFEGLVDAGLADYDYDTAHQPGARFAPLYFVSGKLFSPDIYTAVYQKLDLPVLVLYDRDNFVRFDWLPEILRDRPNWRAERITPTCGLPHFEQLPKTTEALDRFWAL